MKRKLIAAILCISLITGGCSTALTESAAEEDDASESSEAKDTIIVSYDEDADETETENSASEDEQEESEDDNSLTTEEDESEEEDSYEIEDTGLITTIDMIDTEDQFTERDLDSSYSDRDPQYITFNNESTDTEEILGAEISFSDGIVITITEEGVYVFSGTLDDGQIVIDCEDDAKVQIVLSDVSITNDSGPCVLGLSADKIFITLEGENILSDTGDEYEQIEDLDKTIDGVIFADCDLTINGSGTLEINALYANGIVSKDDLKICGGYTVIYSEGKGIEANDSIRIASGVFSINAGDDGIHTDNDEDVGKGYVYIEDGTIMISSGDDGIHSATAVVILGGCISITESYEGIEGDAIYIQGGTIEIISSDDGLNATTSENGSGGEFGAEFSLGNDPVSDRAEGMEGDINENEKPGARENYDDEVMPIDDGNDIESDVENEAEAPKEGTIDLTKEDSSLESTKETNENENFDEILKEKQGENPDDKDETNDAPQIDDGPENKTNSNENNGNLETDTAPGNNAEQDKIGGSSSGRSMALSLDEDSACIIISGGTIYINADGDGIDSNGDLTIEGGEVYINGPTGNQDTAIDYGESGEFLMNGGTVIAVGSSGMVEMPSEDSTQYSITAILDENGEGGNVIELSDSYGNVIAEFTAEKSFDSVFISTDEIESGTYSLNIDGTATEISVDSVTTKSGSNSFDSDNNFTGKGQNSGGRVP